MITVSQAMAQTRAHYRAMFRTMCAGEWNLYATPSGVCIARNGAECGSDSVLVANVHALSEDQTAYRLHDYVTREGTPKQWHD